MEVGNMPEVLIAILAGLVAGWIASVLVPATGLRYIVPGICGAFYGVVVFVNVPWPIAESLILESLLAMFGAIAGIAVVRFSKRR
jgi:uncharacterized membrane protein YeaQ/YmgE (transglycosylase-associated protein family)